MIDTEGNAFVAIRGAANVIAAPINFA